MPINFPNSPTPNQLYTYDDKTWEWNGIYWEVYSALTSYVTSTTFNYYTGTTQPLILNSVTGGSYSSGTLYLINNSGSVIPISGFSTSGGSSTVSGDYLPLSGGTVTGGTVFTSGLSANTISATTYLGDIITGATSVGTGTTILDSTTGKTVNIKSITSDTTNKVSVSSQNQTIELGVNEQNLTLWNLVVQGNKLLNGSVSYVSGLTFSVSPLEYLINGQIYTISAETTVTLASGDSTFDRIDVIYADISGNTGVLQGTPSDNPEKPLVDGDTEIEVTFVIVRANSTSADVSTFVVYNENSGPPTEWTFGSGGPQSSRIIGNFTGVTYSGGTSIRVSGVTGAYTTFFRLTGLTELNTNNYSTLQFAIRNLSANTATSLIRFRFLTTGGTQNGSVVTMNGAGTTNVVQYSPTNVSTWQLISIPLWRFYLTNTNVQVLEVAFSPQGTGAQSRYYFDLLEFVEGTSSAPPSNSWTTIRGDSTATTITAPTPNATLILSGGTNISSVISGTSTVVFNLDNNINLNGVTATTISATTYQNLPTDIRVTGGTYSNGNITFTNNTGGTFTVSGSAIYSSGILSGSSNWFSNGNGSVTLPTVQVALYNNSSYTEPVQVYTVSSGVTGSGGIAALTNNDTNYIYIEYNNGSPRWGVSTDNSFINGSDVDLCYLIYRADNFVHVLDFGNEGAGLPNKISNRIVAVNRFGRESGFSLGLSGATGVVTLTSGVAWNGTNRQSLVAVNSQDDIFFKSFHSGGTWVYTTTGDTINNTYYDDGTDIVSATASKYLVNWYFRGQEVNDHLYEVYGTDEYDSVAEAQLSVEPSLPELITSHAFLTGRIIVQVGATTGLVESAFVQVFQSTQVTQHNDLTSIQGGTAGQYYHLTASEYSNNAYTNVDNNFSVGQTINGGLTADTVSATTYQNLPISGLTGGSNISITGSNGNFTVSVTGTTGSNITGGTYLNGNTTFTNNTGAVFTVTGSATYNPGIISGSTNYIVNGDGTVRLPTVQLAIYNNSSYTEPLQVYTVASGVTGSGGIANLIDNSNNFVYIEYNNGLPRWAVTTNNSIINDSNNVLCYLMFREINAVYVFDFNNSGTGLPNKLNNRALETNRFAIESGFTLSLSSTTLVLSLSSGNVWCGINKKTLPNFTSNAIDSLFIVDYHNGGNWLSDGSKEGINNVFYDNGTDIFSGTTSKFLVNWYYREQGRNVVHEVYGTQEYNNLAEAELALEPVDLPELITSQSFLVGRILIQVESTTGFVESVFTRSFHPSQVTQHNDLINLQGGDVGEYYHLSLAQYNNLTASTNPNTIYNSDDTLISDRTVSLDNYFIDFQSRDGNGFKYIIDRGLENFQVYQGGARDPIFDVSTTNSTATVNGDFIMNSPTGNNYLFNIQTTPLDNTHKIVVNDPSLGFILGYDMSYISNSITGGTFSSNTLSLVNNLGNIVDITGFTSGSGTVNGNGTANFLPKWTGSTGLGNSQIRDDGTTIGINSSPISGAFVNINDTTTASTSSVNIINNSANKTSVSATGGNVGYFSVAFGTDLTKSFEGYATNGVNAYGFYGVVSPDELYTITNGIGGYFEVGEALGYGAPTNRHSLQLRDGTEGLNKVLVSVSNDGKANWSNTLNVSAVTATTITSNSVKILPVALTVVSNTASTDASLSSTFTLTLTGNTTLATPTNGFSGQRILYQLKQDGTGSKLLTLSSGFRSGPITVTLSTAANTTDYLGVIYNAIDDKWDVLALNKGYS